jgi:hydrogenase nickel incorporation protein HypA/HybF
MHEFSIVQRIVEIALEAAAKNQAENVICVEVEVGQASGTVPEAMEFAWESARKDTLLEQASLVIRLIPLVIRCRSCGLQHTPENIYESCPHCGAISPEIISGKELRVTSIQI